MRRASRRRAGPALTTTLATALVTALVTVVAGVVLGGCSSDGSTGSEGSVDRLTDPGAALAVGDTATVPLQDQKAVIDLEVSSIDAGSPGDLTSLSGTPYYVRLKATAVSGDAHQFFAEQYVTAWAGDQRVEPLASPVSVGGCTRAYFKLDPPAGAAIEPCLTFVVGPGSPAVDRISFYADDDYQVEDDTAVEWQ